MKPFEAMLADDYHAIDPQGKTVGKDEVLKDFRGQMNAMQHIHWKRKITKFSLTGNTADVTVDGHMWADLGGRDGKYHKFDLKALTNDIWKHTPAGWKLASGQVLKFDLRIDGKPAGGK